MRLLPPPPESVRYWALIPNLKGLERAIDTGIRNIATFMSVSLHSFLPGKHYYY